MLSRSGNEPLTARSPLHLRVILSAFGAAVLMFGAIYAFSRTDPSGEVLFLGGLSAVFAIIAMVDLYVVMARLRYERNTRGT